MKSIYVLIDAFGWTYLQDSQFLSDVLPFRQPLRTVLGFSSGAIPSMLTGMLPFQHGQWNLVYFDPANSPFRWMRPLRALPSRCLDNRYGRKLLKEFGRRVLKLGPGFECCVSPRLLPWFSWTERKNIYAAGGVPGTQTIFDELERSDIPYRIYSYHSATDDHILTRATEDIRANRGEFFFVYLSEMDMFLHTHCKEPERVAEKIAWYENRLRALIAAARESDSDARIVITSDHGMKPITQTFDVVSEVERLGLGQPEQYLSVYDSTMARFWFFDPRARQQICTKLEGLGCGRFLGVAELGELGILFPDRRYGELIFLMNPGCIMAKSDFNGRGWRPKGMHGFHPDDPHSDAIFVADRAPAFKMHSIVDLYRCMQQSMGEILDRRVLRSEATVEDGHK